jgi:hypothetical protein
MTGITAIATIRLRTEIFELSDLNVSMRGIEGGMARVVLAVISASRPATGSPHKWLRPRAYQDDRNIELINELGTATGKPPSAPGKFTGRSLRHGICLVTV